LDREAALTCNSRSAREVFLSVSRASELKPRSGIWICPHRFSHITAYATPHERTVPSEKNKTSDALARIPVRHRRQDARARVPLARRCRSCPVAASPQLSPPLRLPSHPTPLLRRSPSSGSIFSTLPCFRSAPAAGAVAEDELVHLPTQRSAAGGPGSRWPCSGARPHRPESSAPVDPLHHSDMLRKNVLRHTVQL
jgi:hypothetical protein